MWQICQEDNADSVQWPAERFQDLVRVREGREGEAEKVKLVWDESETGMIGLLWPVMLTLICQG